MAKAETVTTAASSLSPPASVMKPKWVSSATSAAQAPRPARIVARSDSSAAAVIGAAV